MAYTVPSFGVLCWWDCFHLTPHSKHKKTPCFWTRFPARPDPGAQDGMLIPSNSVRLGLYNVLFPERDFLASLERLTMALHPRICLAP